MNTNRRLPGYSFATEEMSVQVLATLPRFGGELRVAVIESAGRPNIVSLMACATTGVPRWKLEFRSATELSDLIRALDSARRKLKP